MSAKLMGKVWDLELPHAQALVLLALADHANDEGENVYPGVGRIAWKCGYSLRQTQRIIDDLVKAGLLVAVEQREGRSTVYRIDLSSGKMKAPYVSRQNVTRDKMSPVTKQHTESGQNVTGGVTISHPKVSRVSPVVTPQNADASLQQPSYNHHIEPSEDVAATPPPSRRTKKTKAQTAETPPLIEEAGTPSPSSAAPLPRRAPPKLGPLATALAEVCRIDTQVASKGVMIALHKTAETLHKAGRTAEQVAAFGDWWRRNDWRGKKGDAPKPSQVCDEWGSFMTTTPARTPQPVAPEGETEAERMTRLRASIQAEYRNYNGRTPTA